MEVYYIIVPVLNITDISVSDPEPLQYRTTTLSATIENIGYNRPDEMNITVEFYDGSNRIGEINLDSINASEIVEAEIKWAPSDYGNRTIRVSIDVHGAGNFSSHGTGIAEKTIIVSVKLNWEPYYLAIYIIIVVVLGVGFLSGLFELKYYKGSPHLNDYGETPEEGAYEEYPEEAPISEEKGEEAERPFAPFGVTGEPEERKEHFAYEEGKKRAFAAPPVRREPIERERPLPKDPETLRRENELRDEMSKVQGRLGKAKSSGVDTTSIDQLVKTARKSLDEGTLDKAKQYLGYANERLDALMAKRDGALKAINEAKDILSGMRGTTDLTIVENFLVKADSLFKEGNYREATNYANKAKDRAVRLQRREMRL